MKKVGELIGYAEKKIDKELFEKIPLIEEEIKAKNFDEDIDKLISAEVIIDGEVTRVTLK